MGHFGASNYFSFFTLICVLVSVLWLEISDARTTEFYADNGLEQTVILDVPTREKKEIKQEILTLLGLHHRPKPKGYGTDLSPARFMLDLYNTLTNEIEGYNNIHLHSKLNITYGSFVQPINKSDVIMSFINHASKIGFLRHERDRTFYFDFSEVTHQESLVSGELRLYKEVSQRPKKGNCEIQLYMIRQGIDPEDKTLDSEYNLTVSTDYDGWVTLNVTRAAEAWTDFPSTNLGLYMRVMDKSKDREVDPNKFGLLGRKSPEEKQPFMVGFFKISNELHIRRTRSVNRKRPMESNIDVAYGDSPANGYSYRSLDKHDKYRHRPCQKRTLYVSFKDLGWQDWIIAPDGYAAYYCFGECSFPLGAHMNATNHAIVQTLVHMISQNSHKASEIPKPCCAPTKLGAQSVLYFDQNSNVVLKKYKNMVVKSCGCH